LFKSTLRFVAFAFLLYSETSFAVSLEQQRAEFLQAEKALVQGNSSRLAEFSTSLSDYPLYPSLQYRWLRKHLSDTPAIQQFLQRYHATYYAEQLRVDWLRYLVTQQRWQEFIAYYHSDDGVAFTCHYYWAYYQTGNAPIALTEAKRLWLSGDELPRACQPLLSALQKSALMNYAWITQRFFTALEKDHIPLAQSLTPLMNTADQAIAALWLAVQKKPMLVADDSFVSNGTAQRGHLFAYGVKQLARHQLPFAISLWDTRKNTFIIEQAVAQDVERQLALTLAKQRDASAYSRLDALSSKDSETKEWQLRAALLAQNWHYVAHVLSSLSEEELTQAKWQYWQARTLMLAGSVTQGREVYQQLAQDRSLYGFLAAEKLGQPYNLKHHPIALNDSDLAVLAQQTDFAIMAELKALKRTGEARQHWWFAVKRLPPSQKLIAAKLAEQWGWHQTAILTLVKADYWDDLTVRFPVRYLNEVQTHAQQQQLNPALVFALIRQESMLDETAQSSVGARGLMQLMPRTAQDIAEQLNEPWQSASQLFNPEVNIKYGSFYYKQLLRSFNGNLALATAAYNAGPRRVLQWLPTSDTMPTDSWIETIPFKETRQYVFAVLSYAVIYQHRLQSESFNLTHLLPDLLPTKN
jgi:soluble lytic murein transglycosylase